MTIFGGIGGGTPFSNKLIKEVEHSHTLALSLKSLLKKYGVNLNYIKYHIETNDHQRVIVPENLYTAMVFRGCDIPLLTIYYEAVKMDNIIYYRNNGLHISDADRCNVTDRLFENGKNYKRDLLKVHNEELLIRYRERLLCLLK